MFGAGEVPMNKTAFGKQYTFEDVARLVCKGADPTDGLVRHFRACQESTALMCGG